MERTIPKNGKKEKSCVLLKELSKIYDIMDIELYIPLDVGTINSDVPQVTEEAGKGENAYADLWKQCCADDRGKL